MTTEQNYRNIVVELYNQISTRALPERQQDLHELPLEKIFVKLNVTIEQREIIYEKERDERLLRHERLEKKTITLSIAEALQKYRHLLITGSPGSGKTTLLRWLAVTFAQNQQGKADRLGNSFQQARLPILVELRGFMAQLTDLTIVPNLAEEISRYIIKNAHFTGIDADWVKSELKNPCLVLIDGLDEIANAHDRQQL